MSSIATTAVEPAPPRTRRPWWRLHRSTWLAVVAAAAVLVFYNVAEFERIELPGGFVNGWAQGWPWRWRTALLDMPAEYFFAVVAADLALVGSLLAAFAAALEFRRRRRASVWQWTLSDLLGAILLASLVAAGARTVMLWSDDEDWTSRLVLSRDTRSSFVVEDVFLPAVLRRPFVRMWHAGEIAAIKQNALLHHPSNLTELFFAPTQRIREAAMWRLNGSELDEMAPLTGIESLVISFAENEDSFQYVERLPTLRRLKAVGHFTSSELFRLSALKRLTSLEIRNSENSHDSDGSLLPIGELIPLQQLQYAGRADRLGFQPLARLIHLRKLHLHLHSDYECSLEPLASLANLEELNLTGRDFVSFEVISHFHNLIRLDLSETRLCDTDLAHLALCRMMRHLALESTNITDAGLPALVGLQELRSLELSNTHITDDGIAALPPFPHLERLELANTRITNQGVRSLRKLPRLRELNLGTTVIDDAAIDDLIAIASLEQVHLNGTNVFEPARERLEKTLRERSRKSEVP